MILFYTRCFTIPWIYSTLVSYYFALVRIVVLFYYSTTFYLILLPIILVGVSIFVLPNIIYIYTLETREEEIVVYLSTVVEIIL